MMPVYLVRFVRIQRIVGEVIGSHKEQPTHGWKRIKGNLLFFTFAGIRVCRSSMMERFVQSRSWKIAKSL